MHWSTILSSSVLVLQSTAFNMSPSFVLNRGVELGKMTLLSTTREVGESGGASHRASIDVVPSFKVMDMVARANELDEMGASICHLEVGQPVQAAPPQVLEAAKNALVDDRLGYTSALGISELRASIAESYGRYPDVGGKGTVDSSRVVVVTGSSAGFLLVFTAAFDPGDVVAIPTTCYPCYRNILGALGVGTANLPLNKEFKITAKELIEEVQRRRDAGMDRIKGLILSSPGNPTGACLNKEEIYELCEVCEREGIRFISDEIYHGIVYGSLKDNEATALGCESGRRSAIVINSFSKYQCMTGWRLGWVVLPSGDPGLADAINRLAQNVYINAPTLSQRAALALFDDDEVTKELDARVEEYGKSREVVLNTLKELGLDGPGRVAPAEGAFYVYVDLGEEARGDAPGLCMRLLEESGVAITPGNDFEDKEGGLGNQRVRFSYAGGIEVVEEGMRRFKEFWPKWVEGRG
ncbi:hypothetical protein TrCOL_g12575 [Triparma columacea]|uniref:Aminotransferase class I/classII large domain-containing protein n=1 Tax=Triparma columacea TaxID=722753 RepID=A0A9W7GNN4_9STRA|nr:hypothetical protein TrCOL_g12575 [Triparma columacea]